MTDATPQVQRLLMLAFDYRTAITQEEAEVAFGALESALTAALAETEQLREKDQRWQAEMDKANAEVLRLCREKAALAPPKDAGGLPALPEPVANVDMSNPIEGLKHARPGKSYYTHDQMLAYARAAIAASRAEQQAEQTNNDSDGREGAASALPVTDTPAGASPPSRQAVQGEVADVLARLRPMLAHSMGFDRETLARAADLLERLASRQAPVPAIYTSREQLDDAIAGKAEAIVVSTVAEGVTDYGDSAVALYELKNASPVPQQVEPQSSAEISAEIGRLQSRVHYLTTRITGDPVGGIGLKAGGEPR